MVDFTSLLNTRVDEAERPKPLVPGTYLATVSKFKMEESSQKKTPCIRYSFKLIAPQADVDVAALPEGWQKRELNTDFYLTEDAKFRLREFLEQCGVSVNGRTFDQCIGEAVNTQVLISVVNTPSSKDPASIYSNISGTAAAQ